MLKKKAVIHLFFGFYRAISFLFPHQCKFYPSCSHYAQEAFLTYPIPKALIMSLWRILRCNPFNRGGFDPLLHKSHG